MPKVDAAELWGLNYRLTMSVMTGVAPSIRKLGLELKELFLLATVDEHPHPADLARELLIPKPTVTVLVKHLEALGFVRRQIDPADLRRHRLTLTAAGRKTAAHAVTLLAEAFGERLGRLTSSEQSELRSLIEKMG